MRLQSKKLIAVLCALAMIISVFPVQADAAAKPKFIIYRIITILSRVCSTGLKKPFI